MSTNALNNASTTLRELTGEMTLEQIRTMGGARIRQLKEQIRTFARSQSPEDLQRVQRLGAVLSARKSMVGLARDIAQAERRNELDFVHSALEELDQELITQGVIRLRYDGLPGQALGHIELLGDQSLQFFRAQPTWVNVVATAGIAAGVVYMWTKFRSWTGATLAAGATAVAGTAAYLGIPWVRDVFNRMFQGSQAETLTTEQQTISDNLQKREKQTNQYYGQFAKLRGTNSQGELGVSIASTRDAVRLERIDLEAAIPLFNSQSPRQALFRMRLAKLQIISRELDAADTRNAPPRVITPQGTKTNVQGQQGTKTNAPPVAPAATKQAADVRGQQGTKVAPVLPTPQEQKIQVTAKPPRSERQPTYVPPIAPVPVGPPQPDIDPVTGLPRAVPVQPAARVDNQGNPLPVAPVMPMPFRSLDPNNSVPPVPGIPQFDQNGNVIPPPPPPQLDENGNAIVPSAPPLPQPPVGPQQPNGPLRIG
ncbi:MAG: hypothetical protein HOO67_06610 [Candidatus Peribacteraceae bacterium]|nr:hypothetical protein [Candidatus Peribacteraceae bacterium]